MGSRRSAIGRTLKCAALGVFALILLLLLLGGGVIAYLKYAPSTWKFSHEIARIERAKTFVEDYRRKNGTLPTETDIPQVGTGDRVGIYPGGDGSYSLGTSDDFDNDVSYDSQTGKWSFEK